MTHEKTIQDSRGKIRIIVSLVTDKHFIVDKENNAHFRYDVIVGHIAPRKRNEYFFTNHVATDAEILEAKMELYNLIKPQ